MELAIELSSEPTVMRHAPVMAIARYPILIARLDANGPKKQQPKELKNIMHNEVVS